VAPPSPVRIAMVLYKTCSVLLYSIGNRLVTIMWWMMYVMLRTVAKSQKKIYRVKFIIKAFPCTILKFDAGLLMRPEHSGTKAKTETRECETEIETETETKNLLWDRDQKLQDRDRDQSSQVNFFAGEYNTNRYVSFFIIHMRWMINRKWILHVRWSVSELSKMFNNNN